MAMLQDMAAASAAPPRSKKRLSVPDTQRAQRSMPVAYEEKVYEERVALIQSKITNLEVQISVKQHRPRRSKRTALSPAQRLPIAIVAEIFLHTRPAFSVPIHREMQQTYPTDLLGICSSWRLAALQTPALWTEYRFDFSETRAIETFDTHAASWFRRAGVLPLRVQLNISQIRGHSIDSLKGSTQRVATISSCLRRCWKLVLILDDLTADFYNLLPGSLDRLHTLDLFLDIRSRNSVPAVLSTFRHAPRLRNVAIHFGAHTPGTILYRCALQLPWSGLASFAVDRAWFDVVAGLDALRLCPHLEFAKLALAPPADPASPPRPPSAPLRLRLLHTLQLSLAPALSWAAVLPALALPALRELALRGGAWPAGGAAPRAALARTPLTHLALRGVRIAAADVHFLLRGLPALAALELRGLRVPHRFLLAALARTPAALLPRLRALTLVEDAPGLVPAAALVAVVRARGWPVGDAPLADAVCCLKRLTVRAGEAWSREFVAEMEELRAAGLICSW